MKKLIFIFTIFLIFGCIDDYNPKGIEQVRDLLVIEGCVTEGESVFLFSRSIGLLDDRSKSNYYINDAKVYVEKDNGERIEGFRSDNGTYTVKNGKFEAGTKYRLYAVVGGEEYASGFLSPIYTSEIDSISFTKKQLGAPISIGVSTHDSSNQSRYYMWSFEEIWEQKAELFANYGNLNGYLEYFSLATEKNTFYCWVRDNSKAVVLGSTAKLSENFIHQKQLKEVSSFNARFSELYYIKVKQMQIRKEAHDYYSNINKNIEQTGSIFSPMPSEMRGNIACLTNPTLPVIGYVEVTSVTEKDMFRDGQDLHEPLGRGCFLLATSDPAYAYPEYAYLTYGTTIEYIPYECVDCRKVLGATKNRPDFWPNDHY
jgi:hypothetical protein